MSSIVSNDPTLHYSNTPTLRGQTFQAKPLDFHHTHGTLSGSELAIMERAYETIPGS